MFYFVESQPSRWYVHLVKILLLLSHLQHNDYHSCSFLSFAKMRHLKTTLLKTLLITTDFTMSCRHYDMMVEVQNEQIKYHKEVEELYHLLKNIAGLKWHLHLKYLSCCFH